MALPFPTDHRHYPAPERPWLMWQRWHDLLFAHWPIDAARLRPLIPRPLELDTFDNQAWLSVVPFRMTGIRPRYLPALPWLSAFAELNVRTYVTLHGKPGVFFFSLDAANPVAVRVASAWFHLPYFHSDLSLVEKDGWIHYRCSRPNAAARFAGRYRPSGNVVRAQPGTLDHWLTERYCMYPVDRRGRVYRGEIHHPPWPVQPAECEIEHNSMTQPLGLPLSGAPLLHFSREILVAVWGLERVS